MKRSSISATVTQTTPLRAHVEERKLVKVGRTVYCTQEDSALQANYRIRSGVVVFIATEANHQHRLRFETIQIANLGIFFGQRRQCHKGIFNPEKAPGKMVNLGESIIRASLFVTNNFKASLVAAIFGVLLGTFL